MAENTTEKKVRAICRLAAEITVIAWGIVVSNLAQVFGGMLAFQNKSFQTYSLWLLLMPFITLFLCLPLTSGKKQKLLLAGAIALPLAFAAAITIKAQNGEALLTRPIATLDALCGGESLVELRRKKIDDKTSLGMYFCHDQASNISTMVRRETVVTKGQNGLIWAQIVLKPSSSLFN